MTNTYNIDDALKYGHLKASIIGRIKIWVAFNSKKKQHYINGNYWSGYLTIEDLAQQTAYKPDTIQKNLKELIDDGIIIKDIFNKRSYDKTGWYRLNEKPVDIVKKTRKVRKNTKDDIREVPGHDQETTLTGSGDHPDGISNTTLTGSCDHPDGIRVLTGRDQGTIPTNPFNQILSTPLIPDVNPDVNPDAIPEFDPNEDTEEQLFSKLNLLFKNRKGWKEELIGFGLSGFKDRTKEIHKNNPSMIYLINEYYKITSQ